MIPRAELEELLSTRLKDKLTHQGFEELLHEIQELEAGWEEVPLMHREMGYSMSVNCPDICYLADQIDKGEMIRMFRRKHVRKNS